MIRIVQYSNRKYYYNGQYLNLDDIKQLQLNKQPIEIYNYTTQKDIKKEVNSRILGRIFLKDSIENLKKFIDIL